MQGIVKRKVSDKGFGFIMAPDGREFFFHRSSVEGNAFSALVEGEKVLFDEEPSPKGPRAANVRRIVS